MECETQRREVRELGALLRLVSMEIQVDQHFWSVTLRLIVMVESLVVGEMRKEE